MGIVYPVWVSASPTGPDSPAPGSNPDHGHFEPTVRTCHCIVCARCTSRQLYHCGPLTYTKLGLVMLFAWLLWGDFCFTLMEDGRPAAPAAEAQGPGRVQHAHVADPERAARRPEHDHLPVGQFRQRPLPQPLGAAHSLHPLDACRF